MWQWYLMFGNIPFSKQQRPNGGPGVTTTSTTLRPPNDHRIFSTYRCLIFSKRQLFSPIQGWPATRSIITSDNRNIFILRCVKSTAHSSHRFPSFPFPPATSSRRVHLLTNTGIDTATRRACIAIPPRPRFCRVDTCGHPYGISTSPMPPNEY